MSDIQKVKSILYDNVNGSGGYMFTKENETGENELLRPERQAGAVEGQYMIETMTESEVVLQRVLEKSRRIVDNAEAEARMLVKNAGEQGLAKGYEEGYAQGLSEGVRQLTDEKQPLADGLMQLSQKLSEYCEKPVEKYKYLDDAFQLCGRIISIELAKNDDAFFGLFRKAAQHISNVDKATLKTGQKGYDAVQADSKRFNDAIEGLSELKAVISGSDDGMCLLETPLGNIDASVSSQLSRARKIISPQ